MDGIVGGDKRMTEKTDKKDERSFLYNSNIGNSKEGVDEKIPQSKIRLLTLHG